MSEKDSERPVRTLEVASRGAFVCGWSFARVDIFSFLIEEVKASPWLSAEVLVTARLSQGGP